MPNKERALAVTIYQTGPQQFEFVINRPNNKGQCFVRTWLEVQREARHYGLEWIDLTDQNGVKDRVRS